MNKFKPNTTKLMPGDMPGERGNIMKTMSVYAQALSVNREYKNARIDGVTVGVAEARHWVAMVKAMRIPAYNVRKYRYDNMAMAETVAPCDMTALFDAVRPVLALIGEVNGDKLNPANIAEEIVALSVRTRTIDITPEMAHARCDVREARKAVNDLDTKAVDYAVKLAELEARLEVCKTAVAELESAPGNCKRIVEIQSETAFVKAVEIALGDAINKQALRPAEEILAEKAAKEAERKAKRKANKLAKKSAK